MIRHIALGFAWGSVALALVSFALPWAHVRLQEPGVLATGLGKGLGRVTATIRRGTETVTGELPSLRDFPDHVSGLQVPPLANQGSSQIALAVFELLTGTRQRLGLKSYAVYLVPGLALLAGVVLTGFGHRRMAALITGALCLLVAGIGFWKLLTTDTETLMLRVTIGAGLWLSLWAYVGLALASALLLLSRRRPSNDLIRS